MASSCRTPSTLRMQLVGFYSGQLVGQVLGRGILLSDAPVCRHSVLLSDVRRMVDAGKRAARKEKIFLGRGCRKYARDFASRRGVSLR